MPQSRQLKKQSLAMLVCTRKTNWCFPNASNQMIYMRKSTHTNLTLFEHVLQDAEKNDLNHEDRAPMGKYCHPNGYLDKIRSLEIRTPARDLKHFSSLLESTQETQRRDTPYTTQPQTRTRRCRQEKHILGAMALTFNPMCQAATHRRMFC